MDDRQLFKAEEAVIRDARQAMESGRIAAGESLAAFETLLEKYTKLYRQTRRLIRFSDRMQNELSRVNGELHQSEAKYRNIFENAAEGIFRIDARGRLVEINAAMAAIFGFSSPEEVTTSDVHRRALEDQDAYRRLLALTMAGDEHVRHRAEMERLSGEKIWVEMGVQAFRDKEGRVTQIAGLLSDITEEKRLHEELTRQAHTDALTGILNRRRFLENLQGEIVQARRMDFPLALLMIDIDHFKTVNDAFGHDAGDRLLKRITEVCRSALRERDVFGRLGGEEFAVYLPGVDGQEGGVIAERLRGIIETARITVGRDRIIHATASIGLCELGDDADSENLLKTADAALYRAKREGRNRVCTVTKATLNEGANASVCSYKN